jgi:hypothetical protein
MPYFLGVVGVDVAALTITDTVLMAEPDALDADNLYVVEVAGVTVLVPVRATVPTPWSTATLVALVTVQVSVAVPPAVIVAGLMVNCITGRSCLAAGAGIFTGGCCSTIGGVVSTGLEDGVDAGGVMQETITSGNTSANKISKRQRFLFIS